MKGRHGNKRGHGFSLCSQIRKLWRWLCDDAYRCTQKRQSYTRRVL